MIKKPLPDLVCLHSFRFFLFAWFALAVARLALEDGPSLFAAP
jgi:hypothetical protein